MRYRTHSLVVFILAIAVSGFGQAALGSGGGTGSRPIINNGPPGNCQVGVPYTFTATASGGVLPYAWSLANSTTLPPGLSLSSSNGLISGTCTTPGMTTFQLQVTDANNNSSSPQQFSITATAGLMIMPGALPPGTVSVVYTSSPTPSAVGGTTPYLWSLASGSLPAGLAQSSTTGFITGTPSGSPGTTSFTIKVTDAIGAVATQPNSITISGSAPTCGPPGYICSSISTAVIQAPAAPFSGATGVNQIKCDPSINGSCSSVGGIDPFVRATDSTTGTLGFTIDPSGGANDNIFSSDDSKIAVIPTASGGACVLGFTPSTMQVTTSCTTVPNSHSVFWSPTDPNKMYTLTTQGAKMYKTVFSSPTAFVQTLILDPQLAGGPCSALIPPGTYTGGSVSVSADDNIVYGAALTNQQNSIGYLFAYNQTTHQCSALYTGAATNLNNVLFFDGTLHNATFPCTPIGLHNSNILGNGIYSRITTGTIGACTNKPHYWQVGTGNVFVCSSEPAGHNNNGYNIEVIISNPTFHWGDVTSGSYCTDINSQTYGSGLMLQNGQTGDIENHFGANHLSPAETEPILVGTSAANNPGTTWVAPTINEMWAFQRSPFKIQRFTHLFNSSTVTCPTCDFRDTEGIVTQSQTGKFAAFCSDMVLGLGTASSGNPRIDVFIVRLD